MKKLAVVASLLWIALAVCPCSAVAGEAPKGPHMRLDQRTHDCGSVREGTLVEHAFKVVNEGDEPLKILEVKPG